MTGLTDKSPIPLQDRAKYAAEKVGTATGELVAALARRAEQGVTQDVLATRLERNKAQISRWLHGQMNLTIRSLSEMALALEHDLQIRLVPWEDIATANFAWSLEDAAPERQASGSKPTVVLGAESAARNSDSFAKLKLAHTA